MENAQWFKLKIVMFPLHVGVNLSSNPITFTSLIFSLLITTEFSLLPTQSDVL